MKTRKTYATKLLIIFGLILLIVGCASVASHYSEVREIDTIEAYEEFIQKYPDSEFSNEAKEQIDELSAKSKNTIEGYREFIARHPESDFVKEATVRIKEIFLIDKTINDLISLFINSGIVGVYTPDKSPAPYNERGVFKGSDVVIVIVKYDDDKILYIPGRRETLLNESHITSSRLGPNLKFGVSLGSGDFEFGEGSFLRNMGNHMSLCRGIKDSRYYKELCYIRDDPFFICAVSKSATLRDKIDEIFQGFSVQY